MNNSVVTGSILWISSVLIFSNHRRYFDKQSQQRQVEHSSRTKRSESSDHFEDRDQLPTLLTLFLSILLGSSKDIWGDAENDRDPDGSMLSISVDNFIPSNEERLEFRSLCGSSSTSLSHILPHVLGQRCLLTLLAHPFTKKIIPFNLLGALHLRSYFEVFDDSRMGRFIDGDHSSKFSMKASLWGISPSPNGKGTEIVLSLTLKESDAECSNDVWRETLIWYSPKTIRGQEGFKGTATQIIEKFNDVCPDFKNLDKHDEASMINAFTCKISETSRFGWLSGDVNPIHMSTPMAWLFGQRSRIAHGAMVVGKALDHLERQFPGLLSPIHRSFAVTFKGPIPCGSSVTLQLPLHCDAGALSGVDMYDNKNSRPSICLRAYQSS